MYGSLQSPNFPDPYPRETRLQWNLSVPVGFRIRLYFSHFDLEPSYLCEYDYVKVRQHGIMGNTERGQTVTRPVRDQELHPGSGSRTKESRSRVQNQRVHIHIQMMSPW